MNHPLAGAKLSASLPDEPLMCIAHFVSDPAIPVPQNPAVLFTILVDKSQVSPSQRFIRLEHGASEIHGWFRRDAIVVDEVLGLAVKENGVWKAMPLPEPALQAVEATGP